MTDIFDLRNLPSIRTLNDMTQKAKATEQLLGGIKADELHWHTTASEQLLKSIRPDQKNLLGSIESVEQFVPEQNNMLANLDQLTSATDKLHLDLPSVTEDLSVTDSLRNSISSVDQLSLSETTQNSLPIVQMLEPVGLQLATKAMHEWQTKNRALFDQIADSARAVKERNSAICESARKFHALHKDIGATVQIRTDQITALLDGITARASSTSRLLETIAERVDAYQGLPLATIEQFNAFQQMQVVIPKLRTTLTPALINYPAIELHRHTQLVEVFMPDDEASVEPVGDQVDEKISYERAELHSLLPDYALNVLIGAQQTLESNGLDKKRQAMTSLREFMTYVLHMLAPSKKVKRWIPEHKIDTYLHNNNPIRRARLEFICRADDTGYLATYANLDIEAILDFYSSCSHKGTHYVGPDEKFTESQIWQMIARVEEWAFQLILISGRQNLLN